jgi:hypothetical protein
MEFVGTFGTKPDHTQSPCLTADPVYNRRNLRKDRDMSETPEPTTETLAETDGYMAWRAEEPDGEVTFHLELNNVTLHFFTEEWEEFLELVKNLVKN